MKQYCLLHHIYKLLKEWFPIFCWYSTILFLKAFHQTNLFAFSLFGGKGGGDLDQQGFYKYILLSDFIERNSYIFVCMNWATSSQGVRINVLSSHKNERFSNKTTVYIINAYITNSHRYMAEILTIGRKTLSNPSINHSINQSINQSYIINTYV